MRKILPLGAVVLSCVIPTPLHQTNAMNVTSLTPPPRNPRMTPRSASPLSDVEQSIIKQINNYRASKKMPPLQWNPAIAQQARQHSQQMAAKQVPFGHQGFRQRVQVLSQKIAYRAAAENVAFNSGYRDPAAQAVQGWLKSPGHRKNIEGQFNLTGIGVSRGKRGEYYLTQLFVLR